jgi:hypothetical protein
MVECNQARFLTLWKVKEENIQATELMINDYHSIVIKENGKNRKLKVSDTNGFFLEEKNWVKLMNSDHRRSKKKLLKRRKRKKQL